jgi:hypothetical protein
MWDLEEVVAINKRALGFAQKRWARRKSNYGVGHECTDDGKAINATLHSIMVSSFSTNYLTMTRRLLGKWILHSFE